MGKFSSTAQRWRLSLLCGLLAISLGLMTLLSVTAPTFTQPIWPFLWLWIVCFLPYLAACLLILGTREQIGRKRWLELAVIMVGGLLLRLLILGKDPNLSHDSWRYLWDARVTLHGFSPYVYGPGDPSLQFLRDWLYDTIRYRNVPTIYPPFAQAVYLLSYLLAGANLTVLKGIFVAFDLLTSGILILMLQRRGLDPARCIVYAWCPLPIVEFAMQGHVDVVTVLFSVCAIFFAQSQGRSGRVLAGLCIALATLVKIYPILLLLVVWHKRGWDWSLLLTCFGTIVLAYVPYLLLGNGQVLGFFSTYAGEQSSNGGLIQLVLYWFGPMLGLEKHLIGLLIYGLDALLMACVCWQVFRLRQQERLSMEAGGLILFGAIFVVSPHVFPWYTTALLPWIALLLRPLSTKGAKVDAAALAIATAWYFPCITITAYFLLAPHMSWALYYVVAYDLVCVAIGAAALLWRRQHRKNGIEVSV